MSSSLFSIICYFAAVYTGFILSEECMVGFEAFQCHLPPPTPHQKKVSALYLQKYLYLNASRCWILD